MRTLWKRMYVGTSRSVLAVHGLSRGIPTHSYKNISLSSQQAEFSAIVFSHGLMLMAEQNTLLMEHLASHGYMVFGCEPHEHERARHIVGRPGDPTEDFDKIFGATAQLETGRCQRARCEKRTSGHPGRECKRATGVPRERNGAQRAHGDLGRRLAVRQSTRSKRPRNTVASKFRGKSIWLGSASSACPTAEVRSRNSPKWISDAARRCDLDGGTFGKRRTVAVACSVPGIAEPDETRSTSTTCNTAAPTTTIES